MIAYKKKELFDTTEINHDTLKDMQMLRKKRKRRTKDIVAEEKNQKKNNETKIKKKRGRLKGESKEKLKIGVNEKKLRENKSGSMLNKKSDITIPDYYYYKNNIKNDFAPGGSKLHSSISFGMNQIK